MRPRVPSLIDVEARMLGVLIEKSLTTPDHYPLSLNAATNGCNQKSNRDPVTTYTEAEVAVALGGLTQKSLCGRVIVAGSRVEKFRHTANETLGVNAARLAVLAELLLRGPQAAGELRARVHRMVETPGLAELLPLLSDLEERGLVRRLPPAPRSRAERYEQLLAQGLHAVPSAPVPAAAPTSAAVPKAPPAAPAGALEERVARLEGDLARLRKEFDALGAQLGG